MVNKIRGKFVIVTTLMMTVLFFIFLIANKLYQDYWYDQDMRSVVETLLDSGMFGDNSDIDKDVIIGGFTDEEPLVYIIVDENGNIQSKQTVGRIAHEDTITDSVVDDMLGSESSEYKTDGYIYAKRVMPDGSTIIVALNSNINDGAAAKGIVMILLIILGIMILAVVSFILSGFVTMPAREALAREKRFISDASHELKTPLGAISVNAEALKISKEDSLYVKNILSETARMNRLVENLLTLSKLDESKETEKKEFSLSDVVQEMCLTYESVAYEKNRRLCADIEDSIIINGNSDEIRQLLAILLDNAIKNSDENGLITLNCHKDVSTAQITVTNSGRGISEADLGHIFERFYTSEQSRNSGSFGLGLAIASEIVKRHGGKIEASSIPDKETVFTVTI